jgi:hypothetical protein
MEDQRTDREGDGMNPPKYSDDDLRRELESNGRNLSNWFTDQLGGYCYRDDNGNVFAVADDDEAQGAAVVNFLRRLGQVEN